MKISGTHTFAATRDEVWSAINDPEVLARTIPGCQKLEQVGENEFESTLKIGLQAIKGVYTGKVRLVDVQQPEHYKIALDGKGNNGFVQGEGTVDLVEEGGSTKLTYGGEAQVGGTIASVGQRLIDGAAKTLINQSLKALAAPIEARRQPSDGATTDTSQPTPSDGAATDVPPPELPDGSSSDRISSDEEVAAPATAPSADTADANAKTVEPAPKAENAAATADSEQALMTTGAQPSTPAVTTAVAQPAPQSNQQSAAPASFERRSIVVPEGEGLSEADVARGVVADFFTSRPWLPWVVVAFLLGYLLGRERA